MDNDFFYNGKGNTKIVKDIKFPFAWTFIFWSYYTGFKVNSGEYKLMVWHYGEPCYVNIIKEKLITIAEDGSFHLDMSYFDYATINDDK